MAIINLTSRNAEPIDFAEFYKKNFEKGCRFAYSYIKDEAARDIVQDVVLKLIEMNEAIDSGRNLDNLFMTMIRNKCLDYIRHLACTNAYRNERDFASSVSREDMTSGRVEIRDLSEAITGRLERMSDREREVFIAIRMDKETYKQVARRMQISTKSVEYALNKSTRAMNEFLAGRFSLAI